MGVNGALYSNCDTLTPLADLGHRTHVKCAAFVHPKT